MSRRDESPEPLGNLLPPEAEPEFFHELPWHQRALIIIHREWLHLSLPNKIVLITALVGALLLGLYLPFRGPIREWRRENSVRTAVQFWKNGNLDAARITFEKAMRGATSPEQWLEYARFATEIRSRNALPIWEQAVELAPENAEAQVGRIRALLSAGQVAPATTALAQIPSSLKNDPSIKVVAAQLALVSGKKEEAVAAFREALQHSAELDDSGKLALTVLAADLGDASERATALHTLEELATSGNDEIKTRALPAIILIASTSNMPATAMKAAAELARLPQAAWGQRLYALGVLFRMKAAEADSVLSEVEAQSQTAAERLGLIRLLISHDRSGQAAQWISQLAAAGMPAPETSLLEAEIHLAAGDWKDLEEDLTAANLPEASPAVLRALFSAEASRDSRPVYALDRWKSALRQIQTPGALLSFAARIAARQNWDEAWEMTRRRSIELEPENVDAIKDLANYYRKKRLLVPMMDMLGLQARIDPSDMRLKNSVLLCRVLLQHGNSESNLAEAEELYEHAPTNELFATTYALALYRADRAEEAAEIFAAMGPEAFKNPERSIYYGAVLASLGKNAEALRYLQKPISADEQLFPEIETLRQEALDLALDEPGPESTSPPAQPATAPPP